MKKTTLALTISFMVLTSLFIMQCSCQPVGIQEGKTITYSYIRTYSGDGTMQMGNADYIIESINDTSLEFTIIGRTTVSALIKYENGYPVYASMIEALIYLPPQAIQASQQGNIAWVDNIDANLMVGLNDKSVETFDLYTGTGTYKSVNITMQFTGGTLSLFYDVNTGALLYQEFRYPTGDIVTQSMTSINYTSWLLSNTNYLSLILPILTLASIIITVLVCVVRRKPKSVGAKDASSKNALVFTLVAAVLAVVAVFVPWSQTQTALTYLPYSLPTYFTYNIFTPAPDLNFLVASVTAHLAAITTWVSVGLILLSSKKTLLRITSVVSIIFAIVSAALFLLTGQSIHVGMPLVLASVALLALSLVTSAKIITITIEPEKPSHNKPEADQNQL
ncbi:MAG: hypothetical protein GX648_01300 [Crenarchaeota archaeon]|nr:hypothetical protein [Thermoproteota archaeon]